jgi:DNA-binding NarL/FixJ family response regulator
VSSKEYRVLIVGNHPLFYHGISNMLRKQEGIKVVGVAKNGEAIQRLIRVMRPDVVVVDDNEARLQASNPTPAIRAIDPSLRIILLSLGENSMSIFRSHFVESAGLPDLVSAIRGEE